MKTDNNNLKNRNQGIYKYSQAIDLIDNNKHDYTVIDRTKMDDIYVDFDVPNSDSVENDNRNLEIEKISKRDNVINDRFSNAKELSHYDDIADIIEKDRLKARNYKNFQKNNVKFYKSIEQQIFEETKRILDLEDLDAYQSQSLDDVHLVGDKYLTTNNDVNTIISVAADKDKHFLDLISNDSNISNIKKPEFVDLKTNVNNLKKPNIEEVKEFKSEEIEIIPPYNQELDDLNQRLIVDKENNQSSPPIIPKIIPVVENENAPSPSMSDKTKPVVENVPPPIVPIVPSQNPSFNNSTTATRHVSSVPLPEIPKPSTTLTDTEYEKIKKYINNYTNSENDAIANGVNNIKVSDALKVNLYKNFYLTQNDLLDSKKEQDKNLKNMINEYEKTLRDIHTYELKKEIREFENKTAPFVSSISATKENLEKEALNTQLVQSENKELKEKIKELNAKINESLKPIDSKVNPTNVVNKDKPVFAFTESEKLPIAKQVPKIEISKNQKLQDIANNTLKPLNDPKMEVVSLENTNAKKPIVFKEKTNLSIYSVTKNDNQDAKKFSLNDALNKKKNALFSSFNANIANSQDEKPQIFSIADATKKKK